MKTLVASLIILTILILPTCISKRADSRGETYAGAETCQKCHADIYNSYIHTAHYNTSSSSLPDFVQKEFNHQFKFNDSVSVAMEKIGDQYYQTVYQNGIRKSSAPFDIVVGSGRKAQTYLYYNEIGKISQLPISYFVSQHVWANSPGFPADQPKFDRNIPSYCMGCHNSFIGVQQTYKGVALEEKFEKGNIIYGIDCERCHGPSLSHVEYQTSHPEDKTGKYITKIESLNRIQKNDGCALCHSGFRNSQQSIFQYKPGDDIDNFYVPEYGRADTSNMDVHGNQAQLMMASKCYQQSNTMTCTSCHNVHVKERDKMETFSQRCITCHKQVEHSFTMKADILQNNCIDCHMPLKASSLITMMMKAKMDAYPDYIRTHLIAIYKDETKRYLDSLTR